MSSPDPTVTAALIALNEENNIGPCLKTLDWADEIVMVDSGSTDATIERARALGAKVVESAFVDFAVQKNRAIQESSKDWIFFIDADERVTPELATRIQQIVRADERTAVYAVKRNSTLFGRLFRYTGTQDDFPVRLFPRALARFEQPVHEVVATALPVVKIHEPLMHHSTRDLKQYFSKMDHYLALEMQALKLKGKRVAWWDPWLRAPAKFLKLYLIQLGILDGFQGFLFSVLSGYYDYRKYKMFYGLSSRGRA